MNHSDLEELLEETEQPQRKWSFPTRVLVILGVVGLASLGVLSFRGKGLRSKSGEFVGLQEVDVDDDVDDGDEEVTTCFVQGMYYAEPVKLPGTERTVEMSAESCQQRCQVVDGCMHFTFWPDGGCLLTGDESYVKAAPYKYSETMSGPKFCQDAIDAAKEAISTAGSAASSGIQQASDSASSGLQQAADTVTSGIQQAQSAWGSAADATESVAKEVVPPAPGINGTSCSKYPACVAVGISDGDCCPNADAVKLGCCEGFPPKAVEEVKILAGSECSKLLGVARARGTLYHYNYLCWVDISKCFHAMNFVFEGLHASTKASVFKFLSNLRGSSKLCALQVPCLCRSEHHWRLLPYT